MTQPHSGGVATTGSGRTSPAPGVRYIGSGNADKAQATTGGRGRSEQAVGRARARGTSAPPRGGRVTGKGSSQPGGGRIIHQRKPGGGSSRIGGQGPSGSTGVTRRPPGDTHIVGRAVPRQRGRLAASPGYTDSGRRGSGSRGAVRYGFGSRNRYGYGYGYGSARRGYGPRYASVYRHAYLPGYVHPSVYGSFFYFPGYAFSVGLSYGHGYGYGYSGYAYNPYGYASYGYYPTNYADPYTGFLRLKIRPRDAQVFVDGYYVGVVDEFDGIFQRLRLEEGPHHIEIRHPVYAPLEFEVLIVIGEKVTYEGELYRH